MTWIDDEIADYRSRLVSDDREEFDDRFEEAYDDLSDEEIYDELVNKIEREEEHLELITAVSSAFHHDEFADGFDSGYRFAFTEPLEEQNTSIVGEEGVKNGDVLLAKKSNNSAHICIVECKAGGSAGRDWVQELNEIRGVVETPRHRDTLKDQLGVDEIIHEQYVLLGRLTQILSMDYDEISSDLEIPENYAFCGYDLGDQEIVKVHGNIQDGDLASVFNNTMDAGKVENPIEFTFGDHPLIQIKSLIERILTDNWIQEDDHPFEFNRSEFSNKFDDELQVGFTGEVRTELVNSRVDTLLELGGEIGLLTSSPSDINSNRDYRILFQGKRLKSAKDAADSKYLEFKTEEKRNERAFDSVRAEFTPGQTRLDEGEWAGEE